MSNPQAIVFDLIDGRWRTQAIYAGVKLGIFDAVLDESTSAETLAQMLGLHAAMTYRLLRALGSLGLFKEYEGHRFALTETGMLLRSDHPHSLRDIVLLREGPEHTAVWKHLPAIVRDGTQNGFEREFGSPAFEYAAHHPAYAEAFDAGMSSYSRVQTDWTLEALHDHDFSGQEHLCDIGGGQGHLLCHFLVRYPQLLGTVLERPSVIDDGKARWSDRLGVGERCRYIGGDMFVDVPAADAYFMKMILHNWNDAECVRLLRIAQARAAASGRIFIVEHIIPGMDTPHAAKLFDLHMMSWGPGRERTEDEYAALLQSAGWTYAATWYPAQGNIGVIEGKKV